MKKGFKVVTAGILAGAFLLGGMATVPSAAEAAAGMATVPSEVQAPTMSGMATVPPAVQAATISAKSGASVDIRSEKQVIENIINMGLNLRGKAQYSHNYVAGEYMDCSAFTYYIFKQNGIDLHTRWDDGQAKYGSYVPKSQLKRGDLVFFSTNKNKAGITHVGVYLGDGKLLDMANSSRDVAISDLNWSWYKKYYKTAKRIVR